MFTIFSQHDRRTHGFYSHMQKFTHCSEFTNPYTMKNYTCHTEEMRVSHAQWRITHVIYTAKNEFPAPFLEVYNQIWPELHEDYTTVAPQPARPIFILFITVQESDSGSYISQSRSREFPSKPPHTYILVSKTAMPNQARGVVIGVIVVHCLVTVLYLQHHWFIWSEWLNSK